MQLDCAACSAPLGVDDIDLEAALARCSHCAAVHDLAGGRRAPLGEARQPPRDRLKVPMPLRFEVDQSRGFEVSWRWFRPRYIFLAFFCVAWDSFLLTWYGAAFAMEDSPLIMLIFPLAHVAVGVGLTYFVLAGFFNRSRVSVRQGSLRVAHGPVPWPGKLEIPVGSLQQLYCKEKVSRSKNGTQYRYVVHAVLKNGRQRKLLSGLDQLDQALWLEQELEASLGIRDRAVPGEIQP